MNEALLDLVNGSLAGRWDMLDDLATLIATDGLFVLAALAIGLGLGEIRRNFRRGVSIGAAAVASAMIAGGLVLLLSHLYMEPRPFVNDADTVRLLPHGPDNSFPSDHATAAMVIALAASVAWPRWAGALVGLAVLIGVSRVFVGVHYPGDVLAAWIVAAAAVGTSWLLMRRILPTAVPA